MHQLNCLKIIEKQNIENKTIFLALFRKQFPSSPIFNSYSLLPANPQTEPLASLRIFLPSVFTTIDPNVTYPSPIMQTSLFFLTARIVVCLHWLSALKAAKLNFYPYTMLLRLQS